MSPRPVNRPSDMPLTRIVAAIPRISTAQKAASTGIGARLFAATGRCPRRRGSLRRHSRPRPTPASRSPSRRRPRPRKRWRCPRHSRWRSRSMRRRRRRCWGDRRASRPSRRSRLPSYRQCCSPGSSLQSRRSRRWLKQALLSDLRLRRRQRSRRESKRHICRARPILLLLRRCPRPATTQSCRWPRSRRHPAPPAG